MPLLPASCTLPRYEDDPWLDETTRPCGFCRLTNDSKCLQQDTAGAVKYFNRQLDRCVGTRCANMGLSKEVGIPNLVARLDCLPPELAGRIREHLLKAELLGRIR